MIDGVLNFHKPTGITSAKALYRVRKLIRQKKSGHAGTLDPMADGVLILCFGRATKLVELLMNQPKVYSANVRLDVTSESFDADRPLLPVAVARVPTRADIDSAFAQLTGLIQQRPPAVSAIKVGGRAAYKYERAGEALELPPRAVRVYWIQVQDYSWPNVRIRVACGRGTYIRALARDVGELLHVGGCLTQLRRESVGIFHDSGAWTLDQLETLVDATTSLEAVEAVRSVLMEPVSAPLPPTELS